MYLKHTVLAFAVTLSFTSVDARFSQDDYVMVASGGESVVNAPMYTHAFGAAKDLLPVAKDAARLYADFNAVMAVGLTPAALLPMADLEATATKMVSHEEEVKSAGRKIATMHARLKGESKLYRNACRKISDMGTKLSTKVKSVTKKVSGWFGKAKSYFGF